jgi:hypothetical protein
MVTVPADTPVTIPVEDPTVATEALLLLHVPPVVASLSDIVRPAPTVLPPLIAAGAGLMVTTRVEEQLPIA